MAVADSGGVEEWRSGGVEGAGNAKYKHALMLKLTLTTGLGGLALYCTVMSIAVNSLPIICIES